MTILLKIEGKVLDMYSGNQHVHSWVTDDDCIDGEHYHELYPSIFSPEWLQEMVGMGRRFKMSSLYPEIIF